MADPREARVLGHATAEGTERYRRRFAAAAPDHFRQRYGLWLSSIGLGTQTGAPTDEISQCYGESIPAALAGGCNVIDTAPTYRLGRAQGDVGAALAQAIHQGIVQRDEVIVCTKAGYVPDNWPAAHKPDDVVGGVHSMHPAFLATQLETTLVSMGLETIDIFYLQNPDIRLFFENPGTFMQRLQGTFEALEKAVSQGQIRFYGLASDEGLLADPSDTNFLPLYKLVQVAEAVAGSSHRFRFLQFPFHMGMNKGLIVSNQTVRTKEGDVVRRGEMPLLAAAMQLGITAIACGGLYQGVLAEEVPEGLGETWMRRMRRAWGKAPSPAQASLHFNRSTPGLTTTLVSSTDPAHVAENLALADLPPWETDAFLEFLGA